MDTKSLEMLEFPRVLEILAGYASFSASRELAAALTPQREFEKIMLLLQQTAEARRLLVQERGFSIGSVNDIRDKARLAALEGVLDPLSLLEIQQTLSSLNEMRRYLKSVSGEYPLLWQLAEGVAELHQIEKDILSCLDPAGEVLDTASPALSAIRSQLRETRGQILSHLEGIIKSPRGSRILQEDVITEREGRYVVLIKAESRHDFKGIVHDISNTGSTVFMEPTATVGLGNALRELVIEERREVEKILRLLTAEVGAHNEDIARSIELVAEIDLIMAKARYALRINAAEPEIIEPDVIGQASGKRTSYIKLVDARHPLLGDKAVPFSVEIGRDFTGLIITGPNTGGKTVTLKTIGLLSLMAQSGMPVPASAESRLTIFDGVFADIGDEQSIEQTLSTFSWHMGNVVRIIQSATGKSLVLLDELGTSTDPAEGSALARAILRYFLARGTLTVATSRRLHIPPPGCKMPRWNLTRPPWRPLTA
jgi:DNA mismatch repair protein MutS2